MDAASGDLAFLPLGGTGEIGMNLNLYRCGGKWLAVDCGIGFGGAEQPEVDVMMPDPGFIAERRDRLVGLVITHAHEDHIGAVAWLWPQLRCPVYATPFAAAVLRRKLAEARLLSQVPLHVIPPGGAIDLAPFALQLHPRRALDPRGAGAGDPHAGRHRAAHRRLEARPRPAGRPAHRRGRLRGARRGGRAGDGLRFRPTRWSRAIPGSEADVRRSLSALIRDLRGRVAVTCFASNVARIEIDRAGRARRRAAAWRWSAASLRNIEAAARECGYLTGLPPFVDRGRRRATIPDDNLLILITGSQGEPRSALARIAAGHPSAHRAGRGRHGDLLQPRDPRQRARDRHRAGQSGAPRRAADDRRATIWSTSPAIPRATSCAGCTVW